MSSRGSVHRRKRIRALPEPDDEFEIEKLLEAGEDDDGKKKYKVKWKGWPIEDATWEEEDSLPADVVRKFWRGVRVHSSERKARPVHVESKVAPILDRKAPDVAPDHDAESTPEASSSDSDDDASDAESEESDAEGVEIEREREHVDAKDIVADPPDDAKAVMRANDYADFVPYIPPKENIPSKLKLPEGMRDRILKPIEIFRQFLPNDFFVDITRWTNNYKASKLPPATEFVQYTPTKIMLFFSFIIYAGIVKLPRMAFYWKKKSKWPEHFISKYLSRDTVEDIKRYLKVEPVAIPHVVDDDKKIDPPGGHAHADLEDADAKDLEPEHDDVKDDAEDEVHDAPGDDAVWFSKIKHMLDLITTTTTTLVTPSSNVSIDEMMIRFVGRSVHTMVIKSKPIPRGYKAYSLCTSDGIVCAVRLISRTDHSDMKEMKVDDLNPTESYVVRLMMQITDFPSTRKDLCLYVDNFYSSPRLFRYLRQNNIAAVGTMSQNKLHPRIRSACRADLAWGYTKTYDDDGVLHMLWLDQSPVFLLTTRHDGTEKIVTKRKRPRKAAGAYNKRARAPFGDESTKDLEIPKAINDYNKFMHGVDIADQIRSYYCTDLRARRTWWPLFLFSLEIALINSYSIAKMAKSGGTDHASWRMQLVDELVQEATIGPLSRIRAEELKAMEEKVARGSRIGPPHYKLPESRFVQTSHTPANYANRNSRGRCVWCRYRGMRSNNVPKTAVKCSFCNVFLCFLPNRNCFDAFHRS